MPPTDAQKQAFVAQVVDTLIVQAAECSRLRDWLIFDTLRALRGNESFWQDPNAAEQLLQSHQDLIDAFEGIVDPDDDEFAKSDLYKADFQVSTVHYEEPEMPWLTEAAAASPAPRP
jgi:hypothetical protein